MAAKKKASGAGKTKDKPTKPGHNRSLPYADRVSKRTEDSLTPQQKAFRRLFVQRFLKMGNQTEAYWGLKPELKRSSASVQAAEMMREDYTRQIFEEELRKLEESEKDERAKIKFLLFREANHFGGDATHSGRVSALARLAKILGMEIEKEANPKNPPGHASGVMLVPVANLDQWTSLAGQQQAALKEEVRK